MCGGQLCRCGQDSGRGKPLPYGKTGPLRGRDMLRRSCALLRWAVPLLCMGVKGDADTELSFSIAEPFTSIAWLLPCPAARFIGFPLGDKAMPLEGYANPFLNKTTLLTCGADRCDSIPGRSKTALLRGGVWGIILPHQSRLLCETRRASFPRWGKHKRGALRLQGR